MRRWFAIDLPCFVYLLGLSDYLPVLREIFMGKRFPGEKTDIFMKKA